MHNAHVNELLFVSFMGLPGELGGQRRRVVFPPLHKLYRTPQGWKPELGGAIRAKDAGDTGALAPCSHSVCSLARLGVILNVPFASCMLYMQ